MTSADTDFELRVARGMQQSGPLYRRVPLRDNDGRLLTDFMVLVAGLRRWPGARQQQVVSTMRGVLASFNDVVFADLNLPLGLLWVSAKSRPGVIVDVYTSLRQHIPEARLVGPYTPQGR
jgi:hypothetical protein